jgi:hypothetical protein
MEYNQGLMGGSVAELVSMLVVCNKGPRYKKAAVSDVSKVILVIMDSLVIKLVEMWTG